MKYNSQLTFAVYLAVSIMALGSWIFWKIEVLPALVGPVILIRYLSDSGGCCAGGYMKFDRVLPILWK